MDPSHPERRHGCLGDRVRHWYTINEPASTSLQGYALGEPAPGIAAPILRGHGAVQAAPTLNHSLVLPASPAADDLAAAGLLDGILNWLFADPLLLGSYPDLNAFGVELPVADGDMELISAPNEVYGFNYYNPTTVRACAGPIPSEMVPTPGALVTGFGPMWPIRPDTMRDFLIDMDRRYESALPPIIITENGASFPEPDSAETARAVLRVPQSD